ncbi:PIR protein [Plasmodium ovale]|uniref:PIR protein n=1 Tax=Plasmodium ovale TaxID=36330 RepID=A0A1D3JEZ0_PLAOA|nr:PIR protein [Plasmodium ovale]
MDKILSDLSKYKLYDKLNENVEKGNYSRYCETLKFMDSRYVGFNKLCAKFARNLTKLQLILKDEQDNKERCRYFMFWIHDQIKKKFNTDWKGKNKINYVLLQFYQVEENIQANSENNNCYYQYMSNTGLDLWIEWKDLYDYINNYVDIERKITDNVELCQIYQGYYAHIEKIYGNFKNECCNNSSDKCPYPLKSNEWCNKDYNLPKLACEESKTKRDSPARDIRVQDLENEQQGGESHSLPVSLLQHDQETYGDGNTNNSDYYAKIGFSLPFLGILSTSVYLYKFTTFGTWIRSKLLRKSKINFNPDDDTEHLLPHDSEDIDLNTYNDDFNINYHPS